eukprot:UN26555
MTLGPLATAFLIRQKLISQPVLAEAEKLDNQIFNDKFQQKISYFRIHAELIQAFRNVLLANEFLELSSVECSILLHQSPNKSLLEKVFSVTDNEVVKFEQKLDDNEVYYKVFEFLEVLWRYALQQVVKNCQKN